MTIAQIKALFQTGKIPIQTDFENLIRFQIVIISGEIIH